MFDILLKSLSSHNKSILQSLGRKLGLEIRLSGPSSRDDLRLTRMLMQNGIDLVIDVGANRGQFAASIFTAGYKGGVVSFEPLPVVHELLSGLARNFGPRWTVAPRLALSDSDGITMFNVNRSDVTSSLLPSLDAVGDGGATFQQIEVETRRLDCFIDELGLNKRRWFLKDQCWVRPRPLLMGLK